MPVVRLPASDEPGRFCAVTLHDLSGAVAKVACANVEGAVRFFDLAEVRVAGLRYWPLRLDEGGAARVVEMIVSTGLVASGRVAVAEVDPTEVLS